MIFLPLLGCSDKSTQDKSDTDQVMYLDEAIVVDRILPITVRRDSNSTFQASLGQYEMIRDSSVSDLEITYWNGSTNCDSDWWLLNTSTGLWDQFAYDPSQFGYGCGQIYGLHTNGLYEEGVLATRHIGSGWSLIFADYEALHHGNSSPDSDSIVVSAVRWDRRYSPMLVHLNRYDYATGLALDGTHFWTSTQFPWRLDKFSSEGELLDTIDMTGYQISGLTTAGSTFWISDQNGTIYHLDDLRNVLCSFGAPNGTYGQVAIAFGKLWLAENKFPYHRLFAFDIDSSCAAGVAKVTLAISDFPYQFTALSSDGVKLYGGSNAWVQEIYPDGSLGRLIKTSLGRISGMSYDGKYLWVLHHGPEGSSQKGLYVSNFRLRAQ